MPSASWRSEHRKRHEHRERDHFLEDLQLRQAELDLDELFLLVVVGEFNSGKSTFINALLGSPILKTGTPSHPRSSGATLVSQRAATAAKRAESRGLRILLNEEPKSSPP